MNRAPFRILLVEDNEADVLLVKDALQEHSIPHELHVASDGEEALRAIDRIGTDSGIPKLDLMLLDLNLPKCDGGEVLERCRRNPRCSDTPVVVISSSDAPQDYERMNVLRISRYFKKPNDLDAFMKLGAVVKELLTAGE
jgi:CheY-like chemotaxis protein